jgi:hypothetical protein
MRKTRDPPRGAKADTAVSYDAAAMTIA